MQDEETKRIEAEVDKFLADPRSIRYEQTDRNMQLMLGFLEDHGLDITHRNLLFAFDSLQESLELIAFKEPIPAPPQPQQPAPVPVQLPSQPNVVPARARTFVAFRNGQPIG